jgi:biotin carboxyl carrier protein
VALSIGTPSRTAEADITGRSGRYRLRLDGGEKSLEISVTGDRATLSVDGVIREYSFVEQAGIISLGRDGRAGDFRVMPRIETAGAKSAAEAGGAGRVAAPMPGLISQLNVAVGQSVAVGDTVIVLEAMKLMYSLPAQISGKVTEIFCAAGDTVPTGAPLVEIEAEG